MQNPILEVKNQLHNIIISALGQAAISGTLPNESIPQFSIEIPSDTKNGDLATNVAMVSSKALRMPPRKIAEAITQNLNIDKSYFKSFEIAGPGFINFFLSSDFFCDVIKSVHVLNENYGRTDFGANKKVLVEFVSANPTGPMHIGNARGGAIGDCLATVLDWSGHTVSREFYVNDAGNQINKFAISLEARYLQLYRENIEIPEDAYQGQDIIDHATEFSKLYGDKYVLSDSEERKKALVAYALPLNIKGLELDLEKYRIKYDTWFLESTLHKSNEVEKVIALLKEKGHTYESEGALWFNAVKFGADQDFVLVRSNGIPTYVVPDIAYHYNKLVTRGFDCAIDILGADHHGYVPRLKAALQALEIDPNRLDIILMQMVRLIKGNEIIKASKRSGKSITLVTLLEEVPIDAARFHFNLREANSQMDFDLDLAVEESSQNPVYYVQYAHARICSILRSLETEKITSKPYTECNLSLLTAPEEIELIRHLANLPNDIIEASKSYDPARVTRYSIELATLFHKFYSACRVKCDDEALMHARLCLCIAVKTTLHNVLTLLKISAPDSM